MPTNKFGLSRTIPSAIQLNVRQRSKFGCVLCRCAIYEYHHIAPYHDATSHDADKICLLCGTCHSKVSKGRISEMTVRSKYEEVQSSEKIKRPFDDFDLSSELLSLGLGGATFHQTKIFLRINDENILSVNPPANGEAFPTLNGVFYDGIGQEVFRISNNVWESPNNLWDIEIKGQKLTIKAEKNRIALVLSIYPPNYVKIEHLDMYKDNCRVFCQNGELVVSQIHGKIQTSIHLKNFECTGADIGVCVDSRGNKPPKVTGVSMQGGKGILLDGTGIRIGIGGIMHIAQLKIDEYMTDIP